MKPRTYSRGWSVLLLLVATAVPGPAAPFSADLVDTRGGQTTAGTFNCQDKSYRLELGEKDRQLLVIVDGQTGVTRLLSPPEKTYVEAGPGEPMSLFANPFAAYAHFAKTKTVRTEGTDSVGGVPCKKQVVFSGEQVFLNAWVSDEFDVPLKIEIPVYGLTAELKNIKRGPQDPALFALPADYHLTVVKEEPEPQPAWAGEVAGAPVLTPPFEKTLTAGGIVRMRPQAGRWIATEGTNAGQGQGTFTTAPFKGGKYVGGGSMSTAIVDPGDSVTMTDGAGPAAADEIIVRVNQGTMTIKTAFVAPRRMGPGAAPTAAEPSSPEPAAETTAEVNGPASADVAARVEVSWTGPANKDDFIAVARPDQPPRAFVTRASVREGNPVKLWAPSDPGEYEVRYILGRGTKLLAKAPLTVNAVTAEVEPASPVNVAARIEVKWKGPSADGDFISVARPDQPPGAYANRTLVREGNPTKVWAPSDPGEYEVRYILGRGAKLLAQARITVNDVTATVEPPASARAGTEFEVRWQGPGYADDFISVARSGQAPGGFVNSAKVRPGSPLKLRAPREPGTYQVRYVLGRGNRLLAKAVITVEAP